MVSVAYVIRPTGNGWRRNTRPVCCDTTLQRRSAASTSIDPRSLRVDETDAREAAGHYHAMVFPRDSISSRIGMTSERAKLCAGGRTIVGATHDRDPDLDSDLKALISEIVDRPDQWLDTPNNQFGGCKPRDLIGTHREGVLRESRPGYQEGNNSPIGAIDATRLTGLNPGARLTQ